MASNLRVDQITSSTTGSVSIGTATFTGGLSGDITGLNVTGVITATTLNQNVSGILTAQNGIRVTGDRVGINSVNATGPTAPLEIRAASSVQTNTGHIVLSGDSATVGEGPQIMFNESGSGSSYAGAYIGHIRQGSNSIGDLVFGTRGSTGDASTIPTERLRITSGGNIGINNNNPLYVMHFKNAMTSTPSYIHMEVTGSNTVGGGGGIQFDTSASSDASNNGLYLAQISGERSASDNGSNTLVFKTSRAGSNGDDGNPNSPKTRMTIDENGNVTINDGNLVIGTSGHGIDFSATGGPTNGTGSSELLDDYEEGSWTPAVARTSPTGSATYTRQSGRYTKIGNVVTIWFDIYWSAAPNGSGDYVITSLPYTAQTGVGNGDGGFGAVQFRDASGLSSDIRIYGNSSYHSDTRIFCQKYSSTGVTQSAPFEAAGRITGWSQYFTNS